MKTTPAVLMGMAAALPSWPVVRVSKHAQGATKTKPRNQKRRANMQMQKRSRKINRAACALILAFLFGAFQVQADDVKVTFSLYDSKTGSEIEHDMRPGLTYQIDLHKLPNRGQPGTPGVVHERGQRVDNRTRCLGRVER